MITYTAGTVCQIAGVSAALLRNWRNRVGLETELDSSDGWTRYTPRDLVRIVVIARLTRIYRMAVEEACKIADRLDLDIRRPAKETLFQCVYDSELHKSGWGVRHLGLATAESGIAIIFDLVKIKATIAAELTALGEPLDGILK